MAGDIGFRDRIKGTKWHTLSVKEASLVLGSDPDKGISPDEASRRLAEVGPNRLEEKPPRTFFGMFLTQFKETLVLILIVASLISASLGELEDSVVILAIVFLNATLGALQENKAEQALRALKAMVRPRARVIRSDILEIPVTEIVPGDILLLGAGDSVPADARLVEAVRLSVDESALTGESVPVEKDPEWSVPEDGLIGEQKSMVFMGTIVTAGRAKALVVRTGMDTQIGTIAEMLREAPKEPTPLQRRLAQLGRYLSLGALGIIAIVFVTGLWRGEPVLEMFMTSVSLAVAAVPEGLPAVVTIVLALGLHRMSRRNAIIRKLSAVETLGTATVICSDKTGTLTKNEMTVTEIFTPSGHWRVTGVGYRPVGSFEKLDLGREEIADKERPREETKELLPVGPSDEYLRRILAAAALCCDSRLVGDVNQGGDTYRIIGDPTEGALVVAAAKAGLAQDQLNRDHPRLAEIPFDSSRKMMTTFHQIEGRTVSFTKGAPDILLSRCTCWFDGKLKKQMDESTKQRFLEAYSGMASRGLRVIALASREWVTLPDKLEDLDPSEVETDMAFMALFGMHDPPRPEARDAVGLCRKAGIVPIMITGDHETTAVAIAKETGILERDYEVVTGERLEKLDDEELKKLASKTAVYARVSPKHKLRIVKALRSHGHVVAMTGDGVNDAPALRQADIGVAMGITGTEVAKEASDMVILDDNFATIVNAVEEGRVIFDNIRRTIHYLLSCNIGEIIAIFFAILIGIGSPLTPIQILWLNLITDGPPALALGLEKAYVGVMSRPPRNPREGIFAHGLATKISWQGLIIGVASFGAYSTALFTGRTLEQAHTMAFLTMSFSQLFHSFNVRSERSLLKIGLLSNPQLIYAFIVSAALQLIVVLAPPLMSVFDTAHLILLDWAILMCLSFAPVLIVELTKAYLPFR